MCNHDWVPDIDIATGEVFVYACSRCGEERRPKRDALAEDVEAFKAAARDDTGRYIV